MRSENCENLQGVFIGTSDSIEVGSDAFKGCTGLFVASRAKALRSQQ
ncbi:MAG: hypothetical protein ACLS3M_01110 [Collinsella sp.]